MRLRRPLTEDEAAELRTLATDPELQMKGCTHGNHYYGVNPPAYSRGVNYVNPLQDRIDAVEKLLRASIVGFHSFCNFVPGDDKLVRLLYDYGYDGGGIPFSGVGYVTLDAVVSGSFNSGEENLKGKTLVS